MRRARRSLKRRGRLWLKRREAKRARKETEMITPLSPLGRKTNRARSVPAPAPRRSEKYILLTRLEALEMAKEIVRPAKKKGRPKKRSKRKMENIWFLSQASLWKSKGMALQRRKLRRMAKA